MAQRLAASRPAALLLCGRSAPSTEAERVIAELRETGVQVVVRLCDVADPVAVSAMLEDAGRTLPPIRAVYHLAGALADGFTAGLDDAALLAPILPKVDGAANLDRLTRGLDVERFVLFSSIAGQISPPGQASYAAANAYLDALALRRRADGLPALSVAWGPWAAEGMAARTGQTRRGLGLFAPIEPQPAFALLERLIEAGAATAIVAMPRPAAFAAIGAREALPQVLRDLVPLAAATARPEKPAQMKGRPPGDIAEAIVREIALVLDTAPGELDRDAPLQELGMDSLMALELTHRLETGYGVTLPRDLTGRTPSVNKIIEIATRPSVPADAAAASPPPAPPAAKPDAARAQVRRLERSGGAGEAADRGRMICFCWAGGNGASFYGWANRLPDAEMFVCELAPALSGDGMGGVQAIAETLAPLVAPLVAPLIVPGTLLFGHSLGALVAYETARRLDKALADAKATLCVSGRNAPHIAASGEDPALLGDPELIDYVARLGGTPAEILADRDLLQQRLPTIRRDLMLARNYRFDEGARLRCRLAAAYGEDDPHVSPAGMAAWSRQAAQMVCTSPFAGDHFYFRQQPLPFFAFLGSLLARQAALTPDTC